MRSLGFLGVPRSFQLVSYDVFGCPVDKTQKVEFLDALQTSPKLKVGITSTVLD